MGAVVHRLYHDLKSGKARFQEQDFRAKLAVALGMLRDTIGDNINEVLEEISAALSKRHRASSAIEGFNAGLRPYLYVHKRATQGFLELFRAYQNLKTRRWGRLKGQSAHEALTQEKIGDWLTTIGYPLFS